ncbi:hypothetical protein [Flagellimonas nanhaiensis]|uniref:Uncharacterized protein n=1 Tax=Flagellimonas nanhaiensis TaxID=2292706 RepID=A0A371JSZ6_9FLAO|nr:hypothetical protein [Allomuricauda nanhaiensis]RDY60879.1 hypothetical protein DX873_01480 [Allomuricauda nanhaiensis]
MSYSFRPYQQRKQQLFRVFHENGWQVKIYGINLTVEPNEAFISTILKELPSPARNEHRYGVGFLIVHKGIKANWFLLNWWGYEDIIHQKLFSSPIDDFDRIGKVHDRTIMACVHEMEIYHKEIELWKKFVLRLGEPDFESYLSLYN